jgi:uncharacterized protein (TIGR02757 family)
MRKKELTKAMLEEAYAMYNHRRFVHPDPIEFLFQCETDDRELTALLAATLAYGRVSQILKSVRSALTRLDSPRNTVLGSSLTDLKRRYGGYKHRFTGGEEIARMLFGAGVVIQRYGSLGACVAAHADPSDDTLANPLSKLISEMTEAAGGPVPFLLASPANGSACKRLNLMARWLVRKDRIDPGGWGDVSCAKLIVPLDTHMHRIGLEFGLTKRRSNDLRTALEVTDGFRRFCPDDPVRYDFALTRMGILGNNGGDPGKRHR